MPVVLAGLLAYLPPHAAFGAEGFETASHGANASYGQQHAFDDEDGLSNAGDVAKTLDSEDEYSGATLLTEAVVAQANGEDTEGPWIDPDGLHLSKQVVTYIPWEEWHYDVDKRDYTNVDSLSFKIHVTDDSKIASCSIGYTIHPDYITGFDGRRVNFDVPQIRQTFDLKLISGTDTDGIWGLDWRVSGGLGRYMPVSMRAEDENGNVTYVRLGLDYEKTEYEGLMSERSSENLSFTAIPPGYALVIYDVDDWPSSIANQYHAVKIGDPTPEYVGNLENGTISGWERPGVVFEGWTPDVAPTVTEDARYVAVWRKARTYTVTFTDGCGGQAFADEVITVEEGKPAYSPIRQPTRSGYTFTGWDRELATSVTSDLTYSATWSKAEPTTYTVTFKDGCGGAVFQDKVFTVDEGQPVPDPGTIPTRSGYTFVRWDMEPAASVTSDLTYTAMWKYDPKFYTVRFTDGCGETVFRDKIFPVAEGNPVPDPELTPTRAGYTFTGWDRKLASSVTSDLTYMATWSKTGQTPEPTTYTVTFKDGCGGTVFRDEVVTVEEGQPVPDPDLNLRRVGYKFDGWDRKLASSVTSDLTYKARWVEDVSEPTTKTLDVSPTTIAPVTYNGRQYRPTVSVSHDGEPARLGTDYEVVYGENVHAGTGNVTVRGLGDYAGRNTVIAFRINRKSATIKADDLSKKQGESDPTYAGVTSGIGGGDRLEDLTNEREPGEAPGTYAIRVSKAKIVSADGSDVTSDYDITYINGTLTIVAASSGSQTKPDTTQTNTSTNTSTNTTNTTNTSTNTTSTPSTSTTVNYAWAAVPGLLRPYGNQGAHLYGRPYLYGYQPSWDYPWNWNYRRGWFNRWDWGYRPYDDWYDRDRDRNSDNGSQSTTSDTLSTSTMAGQVTPTIRRTTSAAQTPATTQGSTGSLTAPVQTTPATNGVGKRITRATAVAPSPVTPGTVGKSPAVTRIAGPTRYDTMGQIVSTAFTESDWVVVASGTGYADALSAVALAGAHQAPVVLTDSHALSPEAADQIRRLGATHCLIVGGSSAVSAKVEDELRELVADTVRVQGKDRYETSANALAAASAASGKSDTLIVCSGTSFADTLSAGPYAWATASPIVLANKSGVLSNSEVSAIKSQPGIRRVLLVGGTAAVSDEVKRQLGSDFSYERIGGSNRYETSSEMARFATAHGLSWKNMVVSTGADYADALAGGALAGKSGAPLLLIDPSGSKAASLIAEHAKDVSHVTILGGNDAISPSAEDAIGRALD